MNYSNTARVLYTFIFGLTDNTLLSGIQIQQLASEPVKFNSLWTALEKLDINANAREIEDYLERFEI